MDLDNLHNLKRRDLQRLCKANNIKANMKNNDMIEKLTELYASKESVSEKVEKQVPDDVSEQNEKVCSTNIDVISESVVDTNQTLHTNTPSVNKCQYVTKIKESDPNTLSPRSYTDCDRESTHESDLLMNVSIKANVGSPSSTREQCLDELDMIANQPLDRSCREDSPPLNNEGSNTCSIGSIQNNLDNLESVPDPPVDAIRPTSTANTNTTVQDSQSLLPDLAINPTINTCTSAAQCNTSTSIQDSNNDESINDNSESLSNNSCDESDKLNRTYTIESPEKHISPDSDPLAALNESLTMSPSVNKLESNHLHGSWRNRAVTSSLTHSQTIVKNTNSESTISTSIITSVATKETVDKENIASKHDEIMSLLNSRVTNIMNDPSYVPEITPSTLSSRIPIKKGTITEKFDRIHSREFSKMKSIDQVHQSRKRALESATDGPTVGGRVSKKPKIQQTDTEVKPPKSVTKPISKARIDRLATPKNKVLKKSFTKQPNSSVKAVFK